MASDVRKPVECVGSSKADLVRFKLAVYVLHGFQKKAKRGIATPKREIDLVRRD